jgi:hypothetical protein
MIKTTLLFLLLAFSCCTLRAQDSFFGEWFERSDQAKADQPHWMTSLVTVTPRLELEFGTDMLIEQMPTGDDLINFDHGKGLELIPYEHVELLFNLPPYLVHNNPTIHNRWGDISFPGKYRVLAGNEQHGNFPTGTYKNGARGGVITPTIAGGKRWGNFDVQSTFGGGLP